MTTASSATIPAGLVGVKHTEETAGCVRIPVRDDELQVLPMLVKNGLVFGPLDSDPRSGLRYVRLPEGWMLLAADGKRRHAWDRGRQWFSPDVCMLAGGRNSVVGMIVDQFGRQRARFSYTGTNLRSSRDGHGCLEKALRYAIRTVYDNSTLCVQVMDGIVPIFGTDPVETTATNWYGAPELHEAQKLIASTWAYNNLGVHWRSVTCETYDSEPDPAVGVCGAS